MLIARIALVDIIFHVHNTHVVYKLYSRMYICRYAHKR